MENHTEVTEFILVGFEGQLKLQIFLSLLFLALYIVTFLGNAAMIIIITVDSKLHTPMYFFLKNLSFLDLCYSSVISPKALLAFSLGSKAISFNGCAAQMFFFSLFGTTEAFFLAVMAYDRFIAVCSPLFYPVTMSRKVCICLVVGSYLLGCINCTIQTSFTFSLSFCGPNEINHFFCDVPAVMQVSCSDTFINEMVMLAVCGFIIVTTALVVLISYGYIITTILRIPSADGRRKTFSTCTSHIVAVGLFFGTVFFMYSQPGATSSPSHSKVVSVFYTVVIPMLNPVIYSLRNKEVKEALRKQLKNRYFSSYLPKGLNFHTSQVGIREALGMDTKGHQNQEI
ncbi:olfactory receptor 12-like [Alligator sinensis]|uniref:Olfactory receptor n=1 Tax=Alligator sinensis TaxID=38654 RepID=A0A1U7SPE1_ALLSI|nr:olfactory receptor 12-like [Alligator sinensis]